MSIALDNKLTEALRATGLEAERRRHPRQTLEHFLYVIVRDGAAAALLTTCGCDSAHLRAELDEYLELQPERPAHASAAVKLDAPLERALTRAGVHALSANVTLLGIGPTLVQLLRETASYAAMLLRAEGLDRLELVRYLTHGQPGPFHGETVALDRDQHAAVILHNDDYTSMEFVIEVLSTIFDHSPSEATALMLRIHQHGRAVVGVYRAATAEAKVALVRAQAAQEEFPLRCTYEKS